MRCARHCCSRRLTRPTHTQIDMEIPSTLNQSPKRTPTIKTNMIERDSCASFKGAGLSSS